MKNRKRAIERAEELAALYGEPMVVLDLTQEQPHRPFVWERADFVSADDPHIIYRTTA